MRKNNIWNVSFFSVGILPVKFMNLWISYSSTIRSDILYIFYFHNLHINNFNLLWKLIGTFKQGGRIFDIKRFFNFIFNEYESFIIFGNVKNIYEFKISSEDSVAMNLVCQLGIYRIFLKTTKMFLTIP